LTLKVLFVFQSTQSVIRSDLIEELATLNALAHLKKAAKSAQRNEPEENVLAPSKENLTVPKNEDLEKPIVQKTENLIAAAVPPKTKFTNPKTNPPREETVALPPPAAIAPGLLIAPLDGNGRDKDTLKYVLMTSECRNPVIHINVLGYSNFHTIILEEEQN